MNLTHYTNEYMNSYKASLKPEIINFKPINYVVIEKIVTAESEEAINAVKALYILNEKIKLQSQELKNYYDYDIFPLEGVWSLINDKISFNDHNNIIGKFMIKQPLFVSQEFFNVIKTESLEENNDDNIKIYLENAKLETVDEGQTIQILHIGPYTKEPESFKIIDAFAKQNNLYKKDKFHREIYLKDIRTTTPEYYQTILRVQI